MVIPSMTQGKVLTKLRIPWKETLQEMSSPALTDKVVDLSRQ
jgi:hypothetical protein